MDFSKIHYQSFFGRLIRLPLKLIPKRMVLPIVQGQLKGIKWIVGAGEHGYWLGSYEIRKRRAFEEVIKPGSIVYDIGANVGYYSLLAGVLVGSEGIVFAFEPLPRNVTYLRKHVALNQAANIRVIEAAVAERSGQARFNLGASTAMGHLAESGEIAVKTVGLDDMLDAGDLVPPHTMKIDVEGAEYSVLMGAQKLLNKHHPTLFLDTHEREAHKATIKLLKSLNYCFKILDGKPIEESKEMIAYHQAG